MCDALQNGAFGYRLVSSAELVALAASGVLSRWEGNREIDSGRVAKLFADQLSLIDSGREPTLFSPCPVVIYSQPGTGSVLVDGQHRLEVLKLLSEARPSFSAWILLCTCAGAGAGPLPSVHEVFERVNSGTPVPAAYYNDRVGAMLGAFAAAMSVRYQSAVSKAAHPQRPNFNLQQVRDSMSSHLPFRDAVIDRLVTVGDLMAIVVRENDIEALVTGSGSRCRLPASVIERAKRTGFHLGLRDGWPLAVASMAAAEAREATLRRLEEATRERG